MTVDSLTEREEQVVKLVTEKFPDRFLEARIISVHKQEGGETPTLRFTLDQAASTDLERERIAGSQDSVERLAEEAIGDLAGQIVR